MAPSPSETQPSASPNEVPARAKIYLCASYSMAAWAWRSWEFIVALVLIELYPNSLLMVSAYGLLDNLARVLLGPAVGSYVDRHERLPGARAMLRLQNQCIGGSAAAALVLLWPSSPAAKVKVAYWPLMWVLTVLGAASSSGSTGVSITVEREAVKALCGEDGRALSRLNAVMRAIDLSALLLAPLAAGVLMTAAGPFVAVAAMAGYCLAAYVPEVLLLGAAFKAAPVLGLPKSHGSVAADDATVPAAATPAQPIRDEGEGDDADDDEHTGLLSAATHTTPGGNDTGRATGDANAAADGGANPTAPSCFAQAANQATLQPPSSPAPPAPAGVRRSEDGYVCEGHQVPPGPAPGGRSPAGKSPDGSTRASALESPQGSVSLTQPLLSMEVESSAGSFDTPGSGQASRIASGRLDGGDSPKTQSVAAAAAEPLPARRRSRRAAAAQAAAAAYIDSWRVYLAQPVLLLCLALALLYMTVLSLGFLMTSFLKWTGLSEAEVSGYRGVGALTGLAATVIFPPLAARAGLRFCAVAGITYQLVCLAAGVLPVVWEQEAAARSGGGDGGDGRPPVAQVRLMVAGLVMSRTGLWLYDLAVTQLIQEDVPQDHLGAVYGVQSSLQASFEMLSFVAGLLSPDPARFRWLMLGSVGSVATATVLVWSHLCCSAGRRKKREAGGEWQKIAGEEGGEGA